MIPMRNRHLSIMVLFAIALHYVWAVSLYVDSESMNATALYAIQKWIGHFGQHATLVALPIVATVALFGLFVRPMWFVIFLIPQQILLTMSAVGALEAIWISQFADGVVRSRGFLVADQSYSILASIGHTAAIFFHAWGRWNGKTR